MNKFQANLVRKKNINNPTMRKMVSNVNVLSLTLRGFISLSWPKLLPGNFLCYLRGHVKSRLVPQDSTKDSAVELVLVPDCGLRNAVLCLISEQGVPCSHLFSTPPRAAASQARSLGGKCGWQL